MTASSRWLEAKRVGAFELGVELRERLLTTFMEDEGLRERPLIKEVADDLVREVQRVRLRDDILPLDRFAQSELARGQIEVTINTRIGDISGVKDPAGVRTVAVLHEAVHVDRDLRPTKSSGYRQTVLPGIEDDEPRVIVCRSAGSTYRSSQPEREFIAENAALAAAIAVPDLRRSAAFLEFQRFAADGGDLGAPGWRRLYRIAEFIGVNISALVTYFGHRGLCHVVREDGRSRLIAAPRLFRVEESLEPATWTSRSVAS